MKGWKSTGQKKYQTRRRVGNLQGTGNIKLEEGLGIYWAQVMPGGRAEIQVINGNLQVISHWRKKDGSLWWLITPG